MFPFVNITLFNNEKMETASYKIDICPCIMYECIPAIAFEEIVQIRKHLMWLFFFPGNVAGGWKYMCSH